MRFQPRIFLIMLLCIGAENMHASEQISIKAGCALCHAVVKPADNKKMIGPSYKEIAIKYKGRADAVAVLSDEVRKGSKGVWGPIPMLPTPPSKLSDADLKAVITWILKTP